MSEKMRKIEYLLDDLQDEQYSQFMEDCENSADASLLNSAEKARIYSRVIHKIDEEKGETAKPQHSPLRHFCLKTVPLFLICFIILGTVVSTANGNLQLREQFNSLVSEDKEVSQPQMEEMDVTQNSKSSSVEIKNAQAVGDGKTIYVAYDIVVPEGVVLDEKCEFADLNVTIDGEEGSWVCNYEFDECDGNRAVVLMNIAFGEDSVGKELVIETNGIGHYRDLGGSELQYQPLLEDSWTVSCKVQKEKAKDTKSFDVNASVQVENQTLVWKTLEISPFSATVTFDCEGELPVKVMESTSLIMADGSTCDMTNCNVLFIEGKSVVMAFNQMLDLQDVLAVKVGEYTYKLDDDNMNFLK